MLTLLLSLLLLLLAPPERKRAKNAHLADLSGCGLRGTNHTFEVFRGPEILRIPRIAFFKEERTRMPKHPCPNHNNVRVLRAYNNKCIHAQTMVTLVFREHTIAHPFPTIITFVFREHTIAHPFPTIITFVFREHTIAHPCPNHGNARVPRAYDNISIHAQPTITCMFPGHTTTRASMPRPTTQMLFRPSPP